MSIKYVVLGYLSWRPMTGYDIKKMIADSETLPWSANNNQIYKSLVALHNADWVIKTIENQDGAPNRHVYSITPAGQQALKDWVLTLPETPDIKNAFFHQLMWADGVATAELDQLFEAYLNAVGEKLFFIRVQADERKNMPGRTKREMLLWDQMHSNWIAHYELELKWIRHMRQRLAEME